MKKSNKAKKKWREKWKMRHPEGHKVYSARKKLDRALKWGFKGVVKDLSAKIEKLKNKK